MSAFFVRARYEWKQATRGIAVSSGIYDGVYKHAPSPYQDVASKVPVIPRQEVLCFIGVFSSAPSEDPELICRLIPEWHDWVAQTPRSVAPRFLG